MKLDEEIINTEEPIEESVPVDAGEEDTSSVAEEVTGEEGGEVVVTLGDEPPPAEEEKAPEWVRELRRSSREKDKKIKELERKLTQASPENKPELKLGPKPKLEDDEILFDEDIYAEKLASWIEQKRKIEAEEAKAKTEAEQAEKAWQDKLNEYESAKTKAKAEMKLEDFDDAESESMEALSVTQKALAIKALKQPALFLYALGKDKKALEECSKISDPVDFVAHIARLEATKLKTEKRNSTTPAPERKINGSAPVSGAVDQTLERLRAEADRTGDFSKVLQYKKQKANK